MRPFNVPLDTDWQGGNVRPAVDYYNHGKPMDNLTGRKSKSPRGLLYFHYDEYCDLTGGASWNNALDNWLLSGLLPDRRQGIGTLAPRYSSPGQFLFSDDAAGLLPLEVLWVKWNLFSDLCQSILSYHRDYRKPHLNLRPSNILITVPEEISNFLPSRWVYALRLNESAATTPYINPDIPSDLNSRLFNPPDDPQSVYASPAFREKTTGHEETVTALIRSIEKIRENQDGGVRGIIQVHLISENIRPQEYSEMDVFRVMLHFPDEKAPPVSMWGGKVVTSDRGLSLKGTSDPVAPDTWNALEKASRSVFLNSKMTVYPSFHVPCDIYSLGMILLRTLLVNDGRDFLEVAQVTRRISENLEPMVQGLDPAWDRKTLTGRFRTRLLEEGEVFSKKSVLFMEEDRGRAEACRYIPDNIWYEALGLGFRLITPVHGFSFYRDQGDYEIENPQRLMESVVEDVEIVRGRIKAELFGSRRRNREVLEVCDQLRKEMAVREAAPDAI